MALIKCPECGKEISDKAKQCTKCGWVVSHEKQICQVGDEVHLNLKSENSMKEKEDYEKNISVANKESKLDNFDSDDNFKPEKKEKKLICYMIIIALITVILSFVLSSFIASKTVMSSIEKIYLSEELSTLEEINKKEKLDDVDNKTMENVETESMEQIIEPTSENVGESGIEETKEEKIEIIEEDLVLENGIIINREKTIYRSDIYSIVNAKITDETDSSYEVGLILNAEKIDSNHIAVKLQCLDEDGFEISFFYIDKPATIGEFTSSYKIPKETRKIQICSEK